jgi:hypothetical protein
VHREVDLACTQRLLDLLDEAGLVADGRQPGGGAVVAGGPDRNQLGLLALLERFDGTRDDLCLRERESACPRADPDQGLPRARRGRSGVTSGWRCSIDSPSAA